MKLKALLFLLLGLFFCGNILHTNSAVAQSNKENLIDSPAKVLATTSVPASPNPAPSSTPTSTPTSTSASASFADSKKTKTSTENLKRQGKLCYVTFQVAPMINWYAHITRPFDRKGARVAVTPSILVDFDLGYYIYLQTGLSYNTTGGRLAFPTDYINQHTNEGFSAYDNVQRAYSASYIELPIIFKVQSKPGIKGWSFFGALGAHFGVRVHSKYIDTYEDFKYQKPNNPNSPTIEGNLEYAGKLGNKANLWSISGVLKAGANYRVTEAISLRMGVGYHFGFLDALTKEHEQPKGVQPSVNVQQFEIFVGITF